MKLYELAVKRPITTIMAILALVFLGGVSYTMTSVDLLPAMDIPIAVVMTPYNAEPQEVNSTITEPVENAVSTVAGIDSLQSTSSEGISIVIAQFEDDVNLDSAVFEINQSFSMLDLPENTADPSVMTMDPSQVPVITAAISVNGMNEAQFNTYLENNLLPAVQSIQGVSSVSVMGQNEQIIDVTLDSEKMANYGISISTIATTIQSLNMSIPGGMTQQGDYNLNIKIDNRFETIEDIENLKLTTQNQSFITLKDIGTVEMKSDTASSIFRSNGQQSVALSFSKDSTANIIDTSEEILKELENIQEETTGFEYFVTSNQSEFIEESISHISTSAILGVVFAVLVLLFFLKDLKTSLIVGLSMPISIISTFSFLYFLDITINMLSLGGLTFAVGMLVDNSIIVLENIFRYIEMGEDPKSAAIKGTKEVAMAIFASTATNIAIFLPLLFTGGMIADWLSNVSLTITVSLLCSLLTALTIIPLFASLLIKPGDKIKLSGEMKGTKQFKGMLKYCLKRRKLTMVISGAICLLSVVFAFTSGVIMMPEVPSPSVAINASLPTGTQLEVADTYALNFENAIKDLDYVDDYHSSVGGDPMMSMMGGGGDISITVNLNDNADIEESQKNLEDIAYSTIPSEEIDVTNNGNATMGTMGSSAVTFNLEGYDIETLRDISADMTKVLAEKDYITEVTNSYEDGQPYLDVKVDQDKALSYNMPAEYVTMAIREYQVATNASMFSVDGNELSIQLSKETDTDTSVSEFEKMEILTPTGGKVPLNAVATIEEKVSPASISKTDKIPVVSFTVESPEDYTQTEVMSLIQEDLDSYTLPSGYRTSFTGMSVELDDSVNQMMLAILAGIVIIYMILAAQFESLKHPLIIMVVVPLSFTGGFLLLFLSMNPVSIPVLMGILMLVGIIVNNAILIVDTINQFRREENMDLIPALIKSCSIRLRPILLTTLTTILGLVPMALGIGDGTAMLQPMAIYVIGGMIVGTVLTLVVVPTLYMLVDKDRKSEKTKEDLLKIDEIL